MVMTVLWAELMSVVARCNLAGIVGILQQKYFDKLDTSLIGVLCWRSLFSILVLILTLVSAGRPGRDAESV